MIKKSRQGGRSKAVSSYLLSGFNIKKMMIDEISEHEEVSNISEAKIIRIGKRPIFKIHTREKEEIEENNSLPNKSFKIRSYTRKLRDSTDPSKVDNSGQIFEKMDYVRNLRAINNRIQCLNLSKWSNLQRAKRLNESFGVTANIHSKIKEIFRRESSMKYKVGSQIFVRQMCAIPRLASIDLEFQRIDTEVYRQMSNKIHVHFKENQQKNKCHTLFIVSIQSLKINKRRAMKSSVGQEETLQKNGGLEGQYTLQFIKMLNMKREDKKTYPIKLAFKVADASSLLQLKSLLEVNKIDYYCIFFPICKYSEQWNLYLIDPLLQDVSEVILLDQFYRMNSQFPILNHNLKVIFVGTYNQSFLTMSRVIQALKLFLNLRNETEKQFKQSLQMDVNEGLPFQAKRIIVLTGDSDIEEKGLSCREQIEKQQIKVINGQFSVKKEELKIDQKGLQAYLHFILESRQLKNQKIRRNGSQLRHGSCQMQQRVLCEKELNVQQFYGGNKQELQTLKKISCLKSMQDIKNSLIDCFKEHQQTQSIAGSGRNYKYFESGQKANEDLDDIMAHEKGMSLRTKSISQHILDLIRKNSHIYSQIADYVQSRAHIKFSSSEGIEKKLFKENSTPQQFNIYRIS